MTRGYRIIEPIQIMHLMDENKYVDYAVAIFYWLIQELPIELKDQLDGVDIEVFRVEYMGAYLALALKYDMRPYEGPNYQLEKTVRDTIDRLLRERPISELIQFIIVSGVDWKEKTTWLMTKPNNVALDFREQVWDRFHPDRSFDVAVEQSEFHLWLEKMYRDIKEDMKFSNHTTAENRNNLFLSAMGLLTYGVLIGVPDIVDNMSLVPQDLRDLAPITNLIFPLPKGMNVFVNPDAVKTWVQENSLNLHLDETEGVFKLTDRS